MMRLLRWLALALALSAAPHAVLAQTDAAATLAPPAAPGMVVTGDREAPLVLYIVPWQEPRMAVPEVVLQPLLPNVLDQSRSLADDPLNQPGAPATAAPAMR